MGEREVSAMREMPNRWPKRALLFREDPAFGGNTETGKEAKSEEKREQVYFCRTCGNSITSRKYSFDMEGRHLHTFMNPSGLIFQIACFSHASGCHIFGNYTGEFTWFSGYDWSVVLCRVCGKHLGWHYSSGENGFFGLIMENLAEGEED